MFRIGLARRFVLLPVIVLLAGTLLASPVEAGSNGQQLQFVCSGMQYYGVVKGYNQYGNYVTWQGGVQYNYYYNTTGWYWVGYVRAYWYKSGYWHSTSIYVPRSQWSNWTSGYC